MDSNTTEVVHDFHPFFRVHKDGHVHRFRTIDYLPPSDDPITGVRSKDILISPETNVSVRLYLPKTTTPNHKLPLLIYIHGGAFSIESAFSSMYHNYLNSLVAEAKVIAVSIEYRLAPEHPIPACYDDSWTVMKWIASHSEQGPEPWINDYADLDRVFIAGDSAGANIAHDTVVRTGVNGLEEGSGIKLVGLVLVHPFFGTNELSKLWSFICPDTTGLDDPRFCPAAHRSLMSELVCKKVLICTATEDPLKDRGWRYYEVLRGSDWVGVVEIEETEGENHVFHLKNRSCEKAVTMIKKVASFLNQD